MELGTVLMVVAVVLMLPVVFGIGIWMSRQSHRNRNRVELWAIAQGCEKMQREDLGWRIRHPQEGWTLFFNRPDHHYHRKHLGYHTWSFPCATDPGDTLLVFPKGGVPMSPMLVEGMLAYLGLQPSTLKEVQARLSPLGTGDSDFDARWEVLGTHPRLVSLVHPQTRAALMAYQQSSKIGVLFAIHNSTYRLINFKGLLKPFELDPLLALGRQLCGIPPRA